MLVRANDSGQIYAMKALSKQVNHTWGGRSGQLHWASGLEGEGKGVMWVTKATE